MKLSFIAVTTDQQFEDLRIVRNECRDGLTHDQREITSQEQEEWKLKCWPKIRTIIHPVGSGSPIDPLDQYGEISWKQTWYEPYLLYEEVSPIGYGLLKWDGQKYWMTAGLTKAYRGKGLSRLLINFITEMGYKEGKLPVWLDAKDNNPGMYGYVREGYEFVTPEVWIDVMDDNPALYGDIRVGYEFQNAIMDGYNTLHVMKHKRDRKLGPQEAEWMKKHGKPVDGDVLQEIEEVDKISREAYDSNTSI